jgi:hypothetical protein
MDGIRMPRTALRIQCRAVQRYVCRVRLYQHAKCNPFTSIKQRLFSLACFLMDYSSEDLPASCLVPSKGNFVTRNAQFRRAVCEHFRLQVTQVNGSGNCFFESVIVLLREAGLCPDTLDGLQLRAQIIRFFRFCIGNTENFCERIIIDLEGELHSPLTCSNRSKLNGRRVHGTLTFHHMHSEAHTLGRFSALHR